MLPRHFLQLVQDTEPWAELTPALPASSGANALSVFKALLIQQWLSLPDDQLLEVIDDRLSFRRFCGFGPDAAMPGAEELDRFRRALDPAILRTVGARWPLPNQDAPLISVVSPVYRAEEIVDEFVRAVTLSLQAITPNFEIVLVEDGSGDRTWTRIDAACAADSRVKGVKLSRNFGQHKALTAGLETARGQWVVVMDCDLQDDPAFIADLYAKAGEGHDVVLTTREERAHGWIKNLFARMFFGLMNWMSAEMRTDWRVGGFSILSRRAVDAFLRMKDIHRHYLGILGWLGFPPAFVPVVHRSRYRGKSSYNAIKLIRHAIDGWVSHSNRLLYTAVAVGFSYLLAAIAGALLIVVLYFTRGFAPGWPSIVVLILLSTGSVLLTLGVLGIYLGKVFDQVRARPLYIIEQTRNL